MEGTVGAGAGGEKGKIYEMKIEIEEMERSI